MKLCMKLLQVTLVLFLALILLFLYGYCSWFNTQMSFSTPYVQTKLYARRLKQHNSDLFKINYRNEEHQDSFPETKHRLLGGEIASAIEENQKSTDENHRILKEQTSTTTKTENSFTDESKESTRIITRKEKIEKIIREISMTNVEEESVEEYSKGRNVGKSEPSNEKQVFRKNLKEKRLPQCIVIGMRKGGTSALLTFLELNKNIVTANKEIGFFSNDEKYYKGYDWYRKRMPYSYADQITIEKTPRYVMDEKVPDRIFQMNSSIKLILIVKEPVLRAISEYAQNYAKSGLHRKMTFEEYAINRTTWEVNIDYPPINRSLYYKHLKKWVQKFPLKQIHIVDGDSLVKAPFKELSIVETFLGLKSQITEDMFYFNKTKGFYCAKRNQDTEPLCLSPKKGREHPDVLPRVVKQLETFFRPWNELFFQQVKRRFDWP